MELQTLNLNYTQWKQARAFLTVTTYYIQDHKEYHLILVDFRRGFIFASNISDHSDVTDFETNIKNTATSEISVDACIAAAIIG